MNDDGLAIALHHGSLDVAQRRKVEDAMAAGKLRGVVCTSSLDLGIDWGDIDLVINVGAPKGSSRLMQRIGRANHRLDEALARRAGAGQSLRGAGMPRRDRRDRGECAGHAAAAHRRARRAGAARARLRLRRAVSLRRTLRGSADVGALRRADANRFRRRGRFRRHRRLCAEDLRTFRAHQAGQAGPLARRQSAGAAELSPQRRHHRRRSHAEGAAGARARRRLGLDRRDRPRRQDARRDRGILSSRGWWSATPLCSAARSCATRRWSRIRSMSPAPTTRTPRCRPTWAASFRSRPISPNASANCSTTGARGMRCRIRCATGCRCKGTFRACRRCANCWSKPFRAATSITSSAIPSRGGWRTRRSACC